MEQDIPPVPVRRRPLPDKRRRMLESPLLIAQRKQRTSYSPIQGIGAASSSSMEQKLELLFGPRSTAGQGAPELHSTKSLARARSIVMRKAHRNLSRRPQTAAGHMRERSAAIGSVATERHAGGRASGDAREAPVRCQPRPQTAPASRAAGRVWARGLASAAEEAADAGTADEDVEAAHAAAEAAVMGAARQRALAADRGSAFQADLLYAVHAHQLRTAADAKVKSANGMQVLFARVASRSETAIFTWLIGALFRAWRDHTRRTLVHRAKACRLADRWRLKHCWTAWMASREMERRHAVMRQQDVTERESMQVAADMRKLTEEHAAKLAEVQAAASKAANKAQMTEALLRDEVRSLKLRAEQLDSARAALSTARQELKELADLRTVSDSYRDACAVLLGSLGSAVRAQLLALWRRDGQVDISASVSKSTQGTLDLLEPPTHPKDAGQHFDSALEAAKAAVMTEAADDEGSIEGVGGAKAVALAGSPFGAPSRGAVVVQEWMEYAVRARFPQPGTRNNLATVDRYAIVMGGVLGALRAKLARRVTPLPKALDPSIAMQLAAAAAKAAGGAGTRQANSAAAKAAKKRAVAAATKAAGPTLSRKERSSLALAIVELEGAMLAASALVRGRTPVKERAHLLLALAHRWLALPPDLISADELAEEPRKGTLGAGGKGLPNDGEPDWHFAFQALLFSTSPCRPGDGEGVDGAIGVGGVEDMAGGGGHIGRSGHGAGGGSSGSSTSGSSSSGVAAEPARSTAELGRHVATFGTAVAAAIELRSDIASGRADGVEKASRALELAEQLSELQGWSNDQSKKMGDGQAAYSKMASFAVRRALSELSSAGRAQMQRAAAAASGLGQQQEASAGRGSSRRARGSITQTRRSSIQKGAGRRTSAARKVPEAPPGAAADLVASARKGSILGELDITHSALDEE